MENILAYHVNYQEKCDNFIHGNIPLIISEDTQYLGRGMYFWGNNGNAQYWYNDRKRKEPQEIFCALKCNILLDKLLDLTNSKIRNKMDKLWLSCKEQARKAGIKKEAGAQIDYMLNLAKLDGAFTVCKMHGKYNAPFSTLTEMNSRYMACDVREIYCVKDAMAILPPIEEYTEKVCSDE